MLAATLPSVVIALVMRISFPAVSQAV